MSDLGWRADGIERARAVGGVELEVYRRPGFNGGVGVRRSDVGGGSTGFTFDGWADDEPYIDPTPEMRRAPRRRRR